MKHALFTLLATANNWLLAKIKNIHDTANLIVVYGAHALFAIIDKDRMDHVRTTLEQQDTICELRVFSMIEDVKDDAINIGEWNDEHEYKLNFLGNILYQQHDWEVEQVHRYLHEVIKRASESMPLE